ncbi:MAG: right-handed parallel beta-helix repeat-containing protein [Candidatus Cloacimonadaceae bacterium]|jgi:hypothetical protein
MKKLTLTILTLLFCVLAQAVPFLIGAYAQYDLYNYNATSNDIALKEKLLESGYNAATITIYDEDLDRLNSLLGTFGRDVKTLLSDKYWNYQDQAPESGKVGINRLANGNYLKMEAEYMYTFDANGNFKPDPLSNDPVNDPYGTKNDALNYVFAHPCGGRRSDVLYSNGHAWVCDQASGHQAGLALSNPRFRWKKESEEYPRSIGKDLKFYSGALNDNYLYLTVAMKFSDLAVEDTLVAKIKLKALTDADSRDMNEDYMINPDPDASSTYYEFTLEPVIAAADTIICDNVNYLNAGVKKDRWDNFLFEYKVKLPDLDSQPDLYNSLLVHNDDGYYFCHIVPEVHWYGNGKMELDYIILEDEYHRQTGMEGADNKVFTMLDARLAQINTSPYRNNILYYLGKGEPPQGHFSMYNKIDSHLGDAYNLLTPVNLDGRDIMKTDNNNYEHYLNFLTQAKPKTIAIDAYPLQEWSSKSWNLIQWNDSGSSKFVQKKIDSILIKAYHSLAQAVRKNNDPDVRNTKIVYIPQIFGEYVSSQPENPKDGSTPIIPEIYWRYFKPPQSMIKCLQFLPLCYSADGILDFTLLSREGKYNYYFRVAPLTHNYNYTNLHVTPNNTAFENLTEANQKIAIYGPYLTGLKWENADCLMTTGGSNDITLSNFYLTSLKVQDPNSIPPGEDPILPSYNGYVQCGYYADNQSSPTFMLVNRRAVHRITAGNVVVGKNVDAEFENANSQTVVFVPSAGASNHFGSDVALYDRYAGELYREGDSGINVSIGPGDGKMLEMCAILPDEVSENTTLPYKTVLEGDIAILPGINVVTNSTAETRILSNSTVTIGDGASFTLRGEVVIGDDVDINVTQGGSLIFDDAQCTWGAGSLIRVNGGALSINGGKMEKSATADKWGGIIVNNSDNAYISGAKIYDALSHSVVNCNLVIDRSVIRFPENSPGFTIMNGAPGYQTELSDSGFFGTSNVTSEGLFIRTMNSPVSINNVKFDNLKFGIRRFGPSNGLITITGCRFTNNKVGIESYNINHTVIQQCNYTNNRTGIYLYNNSSTIIRQCDFINNKTGKQGTGIKLTASSPPIVGCNFKDLQRGICTERAYEGGLGVESTIKESTFKRCEIGIESRSSNHRLERNCFDRNEYGIVNHAGSNLNLSKTANNVMNNYEYNVYFYDSLPYRATIQLLAGYNDFYHLPDDETGIPATDFHFDDYYCSPPLSDRIDASFNWFQDRQVTVNNPDYADYVYVGTYNLYPSMPDPNLPPQPPTDIRLYIALDYESQGSYDLAAATYQAIIDDQLEEEKPQVTSAIDGLYRCKEMTSSPTSETIAYFDAKAAQNAIDNPSLSAILKDYLVQLHVISEDFQSAVDLLQPRISDPVSEVDSLRAVLDLEIVLQLAAAGGTKRPITTEYTQYQYPNFQVYEVMHGKNWDKYRRALQKNNPNMANIPAFPLIHNNYPNPFNPSTTIAYSIPKDGLVKIDVYNIKGQKVKQLCNTEMLRGHHKVIWDGKDKHHRSVSSGVYFVRLQANGQSSTRKIMLMK